MPELLEDADGAPLPPELQRDGVIWRIIRDRAVADPPMRGDLLLVDGICIALAPVLVRLSSDRACTCGGRPDEISGDVHYESALDTGVCYTAFHGWVLTCSWCPHVARGATKGVALDGMQEHYDAVCGKGRIEVRRG